MKLQGRYLKLEMCGDDVALLHKELQKLGYTIPEPELIQNCFGKGSFAAVKKFQTKNEIKVTGVVDAQTATAINQAVDVLEQYVVEGKVTLKQDGSAYTEGVVKGFDVDAFGEQLVFQTGLSPNGFYHGAFKPEQFAAGEKHGPDLIVRVFDPKGQPVGESEICFNAGKKVQIDVQVTLPKESKLSEYEQVLNAMAPLMGTHSPAELNPERINFLLKELAGVAVVNARRLNILNQSAQLSSTPSAELSAATNLPTEFFYGVARQLNMGLPLGLEAFLALSTAALLQAFQQAITKKIIPAIEVTAALIEQLKLQRGLLVQRQVVGRLVNQETNALLANFTVRIFDLDADPEPKDLGFDRTNKQGLFSFVFIGPPPSDVTIERNFRLHISDAQGQEIYQTEIVVSLDQQEVLQVPVPAEVIPKPPVHKIDELATALELELPEGLLSFLAENNIHSLQDIRKNGGIRRLEGLPVPADDPAVPLLEAHANLITVSSDVKDNAALIESGFTHFQAIATLPRPAFVSAVYETLGDRKAARYWETSKAETGFLNNVLVGRLANFANGFSSSPSSFSSRTLALTSSPMPDWFVRRCQCEDCVSAVSPLAYLADLLYYAINHLQQGSFLITVDILAYNFHQPFGDLPAACEQVEKRLRQVRICIEVLRRDLGTPSGTILEALQIAEKEYLLKAYATLLYKMGTSYEELRQVRGNDEAREKLAERLSIDVSHLNELLLVPGATPIDPGMVTEVALETIFGLRDTHRDPLTDPAAPQLLTWRLENLRAHWVSDDDALETPIIDPDLIGPADISNPASGDAIRIWNERQLEIANKLTDLTGRRATNLNQVIRGGLTVGVAELRQLRTDYESGTDILPNITAQGLTFASFQRLMTFIDIGEASLLESEWEEMYDFLIAAWKRSTLYGTWRDAERISDLTLSPDNFRMAETEPELIPWRATEEDRRAWQDKLRARIDQQNTVIQGINEIVDSTEEAVLEMLRDALVVATGEEAKTLGQRLAIDCLNDACQMTTRVAQAIESLQTLFFAVRTGQRTDYTLVAESFDEEWKWLGSYASWRSAMFVFMYPENVLYPSLRRWQTPALQNLISETRNNHRLTPEDACQAAMKYEKYFRDVNSLILEAAVQTRETSPEGDCRSRASRADRYPVYVFARGGATNTVYYSSYDPEDDGPYAQSFWTPVPGLEDVQVLNIVGAAAYAITVDNRQIYLFVRVREGLEQKLKYTTYDLQQGRWIGENNDLGLPENTTAFTAVVKQRNRENEPPHLAVRIENNRAIYDRLMNSAGNDWGNDDWHLLVGPSMASGQGLYVLRAMIEKSPYSFILFLDRSIIPSQSLIYRLFGGFRSDGHASWRSILTGLHDDVWLGGFAHSSTNRFYVFYKNSGASGNTTSYASIGLSSSVSEDIIRDIDGFNNWLIDATGLSLANVRVEGLTSSLLDSINRIPPSDLVTFDAVSQAIDKFTSQWENGEDVESREWKLADELAQRFIAGVLGVHHSLKFILWHLAYYKAAYGRPEDIPLDQVFYLTRRNTDSIDYFSGMNGLERIIHAAGIQSPDLTSQPVYVALGLGTGVFRSIFIKEESTERLSALSQIRIAPSVVVSLEITEHLSREELQTRGWHILLYLTFYDIEGVPASVLTYLEEAWYFVPVHLALELQRRRQFVPALDWLRTVYDYRQPIEEDRHIYYGLTINSRAATDFARYDNWLLDPLNPHAIAENRASTYLRFTILSIVRCMLEFADVEFTQDNAESVPRARTLYETALELLSHPELNQALSPCEDESAETEMHAHASPEMAQATQALITASSDSGLIPASWQEHFNLLRKRARLLSEVASVRALLTEIEGIIGSDAPIENRYAMARDRIEKAIQDKPAPPTFAIIIGRRPEKLQEAYTALLTEGNVAQATERSGVFAAQDFDRTLTRMLNISSNPNAEEFPWLRGNSGARSSRDFLNFNIGPVPVDLFGSADDFMTFMVDNNPEFIFLIWRYQPPIFTPIPYYEFCIPPNPMIRALRFRAEFNLQKLRNCRNIAGLERQLEPYTAPTDSVSGLPIFSASDRLVVPGTIPPQPTLYRPEYLMARAKELAERAAQMEAHFLASLEKRDAEYMQLMKARQEIQLARAGVRLQNLHVKEANANVRLAELTRNRAQIELNHFQSLIDEGLLPQEIASLAFLGVAAALFFTQSIGEFILGAGNLSSAAQGYQTTASLLGQWASYERMQQDWVLRRNLASQDVQIGNQQITLAEDRVDIVTQERNISQMQTSFAEEVAEFLTKKFTSVELYEWISQVLEVVYSFFLQQGAAVAKLAELQLAFERQEPPSGLIQADYWEAPSSDAIPEVTTGNVPNRRGLTGSARLQQDISSLEQYKIDTEKRKLQLTKTISLARLSPVEFQQFRENGVLHFHTPLELFDQDFPGHYLRLIKRVRVSVIALIPPTDGIHATLSTTSGVSKVVVESNKIFRKLNVQRPSESIALSSPQNATGLFELQPEPEKLFPFEGMGVETFWGLRMPKAANRFDFNTIFDVLFTIDYTALSDFGYQQQVISTLNRRISADRPFSFRHQFADQWFDLNNPERTADPMTVSFTTRREDFPPNIENLRIEQLALYFVAKSGVSLDTIEVNLSFTGSGTRAAALPRENLIYTRLTNAAAWQLAFTGAGRNPFGVWTLQLPDDDLALRALFTDEQIEDILFVITYGGETPAWPA